LQDPFGLLARIPLTKVPQELKEPEVSRQVRFADTTKHLEVRLEQCKETLGSILVYVTTCVFLLRVIDDRVHSAQFISMCRWLPLIHENRLAPLSNAPFSTP